MSHDRLLLEHRTAPARRSLGPQDYARSDARILEDVSEELDEHELVDAIEISVRVAAGAVTLTGSVPDEEMKLLAERAARQQRGVQAVHNRLEVRAFRSASAGLVGPS